MIGARIARAMLVWAALSAASACGARSELIVRQDGGGGANPNVCVPREPAVEICNGRDDDCNGRVDDGLGFGPRGELTVLRETEGDTGDCTSCRWAWGPVLARLADGNYLARWYVSISGGREQPNIFTRRISPRGEILGEIRRDETDVLLAQTQLSFSLRANGDNVFGVSFRDGTDDVPGWQIVHPDGRITSVRAPAGTRYRTPTLLLGDRVYGAFGDYTGVVGFDSSRLDRTGARSDSRSLAMAFGVAAGGFGDHYGLIAAALENGERPMYFVGTRADGSLDPAPQRIDVTYESYPRLIGVTDGYLAILPGGRNAPARRQRLGLRGETIAPAAPWPDGHRLSDSSLTDRFVHHPREPWIAAVWQEVVGEMSTMHVETLDESGDVVASWSGPAAGTGAVASPSITFVDDTILVAWHDVAADRTPNRVYVRAFGCLP